MPSKEEKKPIGFLGFEYAAMMHEEVRAIVELLSPFSEIFDIPRHYLLRVARYCTLGRFDDDPAFPRCP